MILLRPCKGFYNSTFLQNPSKLQKRTIAQTKFAPSNKVVADDRRKLGMTRCSGEEREKKTERRTFLSLEEAGLVEISGLSTHERFLCRLTVQSPSLHNMNANFVCCFLWKVGNCVVVFR